MVDRLRATVRPASATAAAAAVAVVVEDRVMPVMGDTNTNPDTCSPGEISVLNRVGFKFPGLDVKSHRYD